MKKVYLAGGFHSGWQDQVQNKMMSKAIFLDPRSHSLYEPKDYTEWDLGAIVKSDIVFAFMEESNPGGYALALEIGYAKALGKKVVYTDDMCSSDRSKYFDMIRECSDAVFDDFNAALEYLDSLCD